MLQHISTADIDHTQGCMTAHTLFTCLQTLHENQGAYAQITLFMKALELHLSYDTPLRDTLAEVQNYHRRIIAMGKIKEDDDILTALLLHTMSSPEFIHLQQSVQNLTYLLNFNSEMIAKRIHDEDALIHRRKEMNQPANPNNISLPTQTAFAAQHICTHPKLFCLNCKRKSHSMDFCVAPGGKMAG